MDPQSQNDFELRCRWEVFRQHPFPAERSDAVVEGVCLVSLDSAAAGCIESLVDGGVLGPRELAVLMKCQQELAAAMPKLDAQARPYFEELAWLVREAQRSGAAAMDSAWRAEQLLLRAIRQLAHHQRRLVLLPLNVSQPVAGGG